jgi:hypothetical protein
MAGDLISADVQYYYPSTVLNNNTPSVVSPLLAALGSVISGSGAVGSTLKNAGSGLTAPLGLPGLFSTFVNAQMTDNQGDKPKAFLTVVFFDERFNFVSEGSIKQRVVQHGNNAPLLVLSNIKVPRNACPTV